MDKNDIEVILDLCNSYLHEHNKSEKEVSNDMLVAIAESTISKIKILCSNG
jgi:hypothetical protein